MNFIKDIDESNGDDDDEVVSTAEKSDKLYSPVEKVCRCTAKSPEDYVSHSFDGVDTGECLKVTRVIVTYIQVNFKYEPLQNLVQNDC